MQTDSRPPRVVIRRLRRAEGQLRGIIGMLESDRDCDEVLVQLAAVAHAINRAAYLVIAERLRQCASAQQSGEDQTQVVARLEKSFLSLA